MSFLYPDPPASACFRQPFQAPAALVAVVMSESWWGVVVSPLQIAYSSQ